MGAPAGRCCQDAASDSRERMEYLDMDHVGTEVLTPFSATPSIPTPAVCLPSQKPSQAADQETALRSHRRSSHGLVRRQACS